MKFAKKILFSFWVIILTLSLFLIGIIRFCFEGKKAFNDFKTVSRLWGVIGFLFTAKVKEYKLHLNGNSKRKYKKDFISIDINNIDFGELFLIGYFSIYAGLISSLAIGAIISAIIYPMVVTTPVSTTVITPPKKDVIAYVKNDLDVNRETYCPCVSNYKLDENDVLRNKMTLIYNEDNTLLEVSNTHRLSNDDLKLGMKEFPVDFSYSKVNHYYEISIEDYSFKVSSNQGFTFGYDLSSLYFVNDDSQLMRIQR